MEEYEEDVGKEVEDEVEEEDDEESRKRKRKSLAIFIKGQTRSNPNTKI